MTEREQWEQHRELLVRAANLGRVDWFRLRRAMQSALRYIDQLERDLAEATGVINELLENDDGFDCEERDYAVDRAFKFLNRAALASDSKEKT